MTRLRQCAVCQKPFEVHRRLRWGNTTCSRECGWKHESRRIEKSCPECAVVFYVPRSRIQKHCSRACFLRAHPKQGTYTCDQCGKQFSRTNGQARRRGKQERFCSRECLHTKHRGENHPSWRGNSRRHRGPDWKERSAAARDRDGHRCQVCGNPEKKGAKMDVDHIVPFRSVLRNDLINLLSVCKAPCHVLKTTTAERAFLRGDYLGFLQMMNAMGWPMERVNTAVRWWGALGDNPAIPIQRRKGRPGRTLATHCIRGHAFTVENTWSSPRWGRKCRTCHRDRQKAYRSVRAQQ